MNPARELGALGEGQRDARASVRYGSLTLALLCGLSLVAPGVAQRVPEVEPLQGLRFETLGPGGERISVRDASRRAEWLVRGDGLAELHLVLPQALENVRGNGEIPLNFVVGDLAYVRPGSQELVYANPTKPLTLTLPGNGLPLRVILGGTARSTGEELAGHYQAPVLLLASTAGVGP